jgi:heme o synthase
MAQEIALFRIAPFATYRELAKPRIVSMVLVTAALGFFLGGHGIHSPVLLFWTLLGTALTAGGASALNQYLERDADGRMERTRNRPLPAGVLSPNQALSFGIYSVLAGVVLLLWQVNLLTAFLALLTAFLYVLVYTPMKRRSWLNTLVGAVPGALPPMGGWAAATGSVDLGAWVLFLILFLWQHPHFYAIAWMLREDYERGGFKMLPVVEPDGRSTFRQIVLFSALLVPVSLLPAVIGLSGLVYTVGAFILGMGLLAMGIAVARTHSLLGARRLLRATVVYLPCLLALIVIDFAW